MTDLDAAPTLEAILIAENDALERHDADAAVALLPHKVAAARALSSANISEELGARLRDLSARNQLLLERALEVQSEILNMVIQAAKTVPASPRYGAAGNSIPGDTRVAMTRHA